MPMMARREWRVIALRPSWRLAQRAFPYDGHGKATQHRAVCHNHHGERVLLTPRKLCMASLSGSRCEPPSELPDERPSFAGGGLYTPLLYGPLRPNFEKNRRYYGLFFSDDYF